MARTNTYHNFNRTTEAAFLFYQSVFGGEFGGNGIHSQTKQRDPNSNGSKLFTHLQFYT